MRNMNEAKIVLGLEEQKWEMDQLEDEEKSLKDYAKVLKNAIKEIRGPLYNEPLCNNWYSQLVNRQNKYNQLLTTVSQLPVDESKLQRTTTLLECQAMSVACMKEALQKVSQSIADLGTFKHSALLGDKLKEFQVNYNALVLESRRLLTEVQTKILEMQTHELLKKALSSNEANKENISPQTASAAGAPFSFFTHTSGTTTGNHGSFLIPPLTERTNQR